MKAFVFVFAVLFASIAAAPADEFELERQSNSLIERLIINSINRTTERLKRRGRDPVVIENHEGEFSLPLLDIFTTTSKITDFFFGGSSDVIINDVTFRIFRGTVGLDLTWPRIVTSAGSIVGDTTIFGRELSVAASGRLVVENARLTSRFRVSFLPTISIRELSAALTVGNVESDLNVVLFGRDVSDRLNDILSNKLPAYLDFYNDYLKAIVERIILAIINNLI